MPAPRVEGSHFLKATGQDNKLHPRSSLAAAFSRGESYIGTLMDPGSGGHPNGDRDCSFTRITFFSQALSPSPRSWAEGPLWKLQRGPILSSRDILICHQGLQRKLTVGAQLLPTPFWDHRGFDPREASLHLHSLSPPSGSRGLRKGQSLLLNRESMAGLCR